MCGTVNGEDGIWCMMAKGYGKNNEIKVNTAGGAPTEYAGWCVDEDMYEIFQGEYDYVK